MNGKKLKVVLMDEARDFIRTLPEKARKKVTYNLLKVEGGEMDKDLFKNWMIQIYGSLEHCLMESVTAFSLFGIPSRKL